MTRCKDCGRLFSRPGAKYCAYATHDGRRIRRTVDGIVGNLDLEVTQ